MCFWLNNGPENLVKLRLITRGKLCEGNLRSICLSQVCGDLRNHHFTGVELTHYTKEQPKIADEHTQKNILNQHVPD